MRALLLAGGVLAGLILVEAALHILPPALTGVSAGIPLIADPAIAFTHVSNAHGTYASQCYSVPVSTNAAGFRDTNWTGSQSVAVLGDSFMEGVGVGDGQDFASVLEGLLHEPVMNLGQASFGTVAELAAYLKFARPAAPKTVVLMFYTGNDVSDNDCAISEGPGGTIEKPCGKVVGPAVVFPTNFYSVSGNHALRSFVREYCRTCGLVKNAIARAPAAAGARAIPAAEGNATEDAWTVTTEALRQLRDAVRADGGTLIVSSVPDYHMVEPGAGESAVEARLIDTLAALGITFVPLTPSFIAYRAQYALPAPYFSYSCDGHWNPVGHALAASLIASYLSGSPASAPPPHDIVGDPGYRAIYAEGVYVP
jgi:hypothetical protein